MSDSRPVPLSAKTVIIGGGLAGLSAAVALGSAGQQVTVFESRPFFGGRATSYPINTADDTTTTIDNCQHILLRCCTNLLDFYQRLGVQNSIDFYPTFYWIEPGGRLSTMRRGLLPAPLHFTESFAGLRFLSLSDRLGIARALLSVQREYGHRKDLDQITMLDWLREKRQTERAISRFWNQVLVSAISEEVDRMAASHGLQVFYLGFLARSDAYQMGIPNVPLADLYSAKAWARYPQVKLLQRHNVDQVRIENDRVIGVIVNGECIEANAYILAVPFERVATIAPALALDLSSFQHSPITGIHLWFDRSITNLPHATLLDRTIQWMFNKHDGRHVQLVVSASRTIVEMSRGDVIQLALKELQEFFPAVANAKLEHAHVVKEVRAVFSAGPNMEARRPATSTAISNLFLAGDWTRSGWPATMEGAVRSGYLAAEAVLKAAGQTTQFLLADVA